jgi:hypothetical protein
MRGTIKPRICTDLHGSYPIKNHAVFDRAFLMEKIGCEVRYG